MDDSTRRITRSTARIYAEQAQPLDLAGDSQRTSPKRSWAAIAGGSESLSFSKLPRLTSVLPVKSDTPSEEPSDQSTPTGWAQSGQGPARAPTDGFGPPPPPQRSSQNKRVGLSRSKCFVKRKWDRARIQKGRIIQALHYEEYVEEGHEPLNSSSEPSLCSFADPKNNKVYCKTRIMVVVHCFEDHYVVVPVFSYGGRGIGHMTDTKKDEHLDIIDHRHEPYSNLRSNNLPPLATEQMQDWFNPIVPGSAVHFTYPVSISFMHKVALVGDLTADSTTVLINHYYQHAGRRHQPMPSQVQVSADAAAVASPAPESVPAGTPVNTNPEIDMHDLSPT